MAQYLSTHYSVLERQLGVAETTDFIQGPLFDLVKNKVAGEVAGGFVNVDALENPPLAVQRLKRGLRQALDPDWAELGRWVSARLGELFRTADHREGVALFLEKRDPHYVGH